MNKFTQGAIDILNIFEDMLAEKGIYVPDEEDDQRGSKEENDARIYGITYYDLEDKISEYLSKHYLISAVARIK